MSQLKDIEINNIAKIICMDFFKKNNKPISPIKLQKSLYFLQTFWIKYISLSDGKTEDERIEEYDPKLMEVEFEAWPYGPVVNSVYRNRNEIYNVIYDEKFNLNFNGIKGIDDFILDYISGALTAVYETDDFTLVNRSHQDKSWIEAKNNKLSKKMNFDALLEEYARK